MRITPRQPTGGPGPAKNPRLIGKRTHRAADQADPGVPAHAAPTGSGHSRIAGPGNSVRHRSDAEPEPLAAEVDADEGAAVRERTSAPAGRRPEVTR